MDATTNKYTQLASARLTWDSNGPGPDDPINNNWNLEPLHVDHRIRRAIVDGLVQCVTESGANGFAIVKDHKFEDGVSYALIGDLEPFPVRIIEVDAGDAKVKVAQYHDGVIEALEKGTEPLRIAIVADSTLTGGAFQSLGRMLIEEGAKHGREAEIVAYVCVIEEGHSDETVNAGETIWMADDLLNKGGRRILRSLVRFDPKEGFINSPSAPGLSVSEPGPVAAEVLARAELTDVLRRRGAVDTRLPNIDGINLAEDDRKQCADRTRLQPPLVVPRDKGARERLKLALHTLHR